MPSSRSRPTALPVATGLVPLLLAALLAGADGDAFAASRGVDLGDPSVISQRGQPLSMVLPYGSSPGERVSVSRFEVVSVKAPDGYVSPDPSSFSMAKPQRRNVVFLKSRETVDAPEIEVTLRVADQPDSERTWRLGVPPSRASASPAGSSMPVAARADGAERPSRRTSARVRSLAR